MAGRSSADTGGAGSAGTASGDMGLGGGGAGAGTVTPVGKFDLASAERENCALDNAGAIQCWGDAPNPWQVPAGQFVELHASSDAFCAVRADRTVTCFDPPNGSISGVAQLVPSGKVRTLSLHRGALCGVDDSGQAFCNSAYTELKPASGLMLSQLSVGWDLACGIQASNSAITCWGYGGDAACSAKIPDEGQLLPPTGAFVNISSSLYSTCAVGRAGAVSCWGAGKGAADTASRCNFNFGQAAPPAGQFASVAVGENHSCGVKTDGTLACWGAGTADVACGDTGDDCRQSRPPAGTFVQATVGGHHSCAITAERKVQCWGYPGTSAAGDGRLVPPAAFQ